MTEVPEYLFERSRQRRIDLGLLDDDGGGTPSASGASEGGALASSGPSSADVIAAAKADAKLEGHVGEQHQVAKRSPRLNRFGFLRRGTEPRSQYGHFPSCFSYLCGRSCM